MEFTWPVMLWALALLPASVAWYVLGVRRIRRATARRFAEAPLFAQIAVRLPAVRRHISMGLYFTALALLLGAAARPVMAVPLPVNRGTVILAIDTSGSMAAPDLQPTRLEVARQAALGFLDVFPPGPRVGLVTFSTYATLMVPPTDDRGAVREALAALKTQEATAIGDGIAVSLRAIPGRAPSVPGSSGPAPGNGLGQAPFVQPPFGAPPGPPAQAPAATPGQGQPAQPADLPPAAVILLTDGGQNAGTADPIRMAALAKQLKVKIYTIGLGTPGGGVFQYQGQMVLVPFDPTLLQQIAAITDGKFFMSPTAGDLKRIYRELGQTIGWEKRKTEVSALFVAGAGTLMLGGGALSLLWMGRLP
ncbi:MAG TPA: VWA domain-containing protein [bacterium]|nr:VWA domain-containing protein [bacterium]